jgi:hypothetical protein
LTNENRPGDAAGQINGYELMVLSGEIESCRAVSHKEGFDATPNFERVLESVKRNDYDIVVIWSPGLCPSTETQFNQIIEAINSRPILYWEGDPWGRAGEKKPVTKQMSWWMRHSEIVFSTVTKPHFSIFKELGAKSIRHIPNTYCHFKFSNEETSPPNIDFPNSDVDFSIISSNTARIPGLTGSPGALRRWELVTRAHFGSKYSSRLYGGYWPRGWSEGFLSYELQAQEIRKSKVNLNWDNFDRYEDYASDRLPIALLAGRPHVTTKHPGMLWLPNENIGLFQETSPKKVLDRGKELLSIDPKIRIKLGLDAHNWVKNRLSHREAARYIMSTFYEHLKKPPADPWEKLPKPW